MLSRKSRRKSMSFGRFKIRQVDTPQKPVLKRELTPEKDEYYEKPFAKTKNTDYYMNKFNSNVKAFNKVIGRDFIFSEYDFEDIVKICKDVNELILAQNILLKKLHAVNKKIKDVNTLIEHEKFSKLMNDKKKLNHAIFKYENKIDNIVKKIDKFFM